VILRKGSFKKKSNASTSNDSELKHSMKKENLTSKQKNFEMSDISKMVKAKDTTSFKEIGKEEMTKGKILSTKKSVKKMVPPTDLGTIESNKEKRKSSKEKKNKIMVEDQDTVSSVDSIEDWLHEESDSGIQDWLEGGDSESDIEEISFNKTKEKFTSEEKSKLEKAKQKQEEKSKLKELQRVRTQSQQKASQKRSDKKRKREEHEMEVVKKKRVEVTDEMLNSILLDESSETEVVEDNPDANKSEKKKKKEQKREDSCEKRTFLKSSH